MCIRFARGEEERSATPIARSKKCFCDYILYSKAAGCVYVMCACVCMRGGVKGEFYRNYDRKGSNYWDDGWPRGALL